MALSAIGPKSRTQVIALLNEFTRTKFFEWFELGTLLDELSVDASSIVYDNTTSGLTATDSQAAIDELKTLIDALDIRVTNLE